jgi:hypothetical protein
MQLVVPEDVPGRAEDREEFKRALRASGTGARLSKAGLVKFAGFVTPPPFDAAVAFLAASEDDAAGAEVLFFADGAALEEAGRKLTRATRNGAFLVSVRAGGDLAAQIASTIAGEE